MTEAQTAPRSPDGRKRITEGGATIEQVGNRVFFNKAQVTNRDLSIAVLQEFVRIRQEEIDSGKLKVHRRIHRAISNAPRFEPFISNAQEIEGVKIFEGLAASGIRSLRYAKEIQNVGAVVACDLDSTAVESIKRHAEMNGVADKVYGVHADARLHMLQHPQFYDVIDIDPYGTPVTFLDSAVQSLSEGGMLCVTSTDSAVLCGGSPEVCYTKYGSVSLKQGYCHEMAIRILLQCIDAHATRHKKYILPVLSIHVDFYIRVFVRVFTSALISKHSPTKVAMVYQSTGCDSFYFQPICVMKSKGTDQPKFAGAYAPSVPQSCPETDSKFIIGGPIWMSPIHDRSWVTAILAGVKTRQPSYASRIKTAGILTTIKEELLDAPLYVDLHIMCKTVHAVVPTTNYFTSAIVEHGYDVSLTHCNPRGVKTNAPFALLWDILRAWIKEQPLNRTPDPDSAIGRLLNKEMTHEIRFSNRSVSAARKQGVARFVPNPAKWGPLARHGRKQKADEAENPGEKKKPKQDHETE